MGIKGGKSVCFRIDSGVREVCTMSPWIFNVYMNPVNGDGEKGSEILRVGKGVENAWPLICR